MSSPVEVATQPPPGIRSVLQVDGDPEIDNLLMRVLGPESWTIRHTPDNASAFKLVEGKPYDLIVTSERTSGREDLELLRKIRRLRPQTRLIILTSESTPADVIAAMREHVFSYFTKPYSLVTLEGILRIAAEGACWHDGVEVVSATDESIRLRARSDFDAAYRLLQFLREIAELPDPEKTQLAAACRELLYNAVEYGGKLDPDNYVEIDYVPAREMVTCRIVDPGPGFAFDKIPHAAISNPAEDPTHHIDVRREQGMRPGGYGILLARELVDKVIYGQGGREVQLVKYLDRAKAQSA